MNQWCLPLCLLASVPAGETCELCNSLSHEPSVARIASRLAAGADRVPSGIQVQLPDEIRDFVRASTGNYGKVKLVLQRNKFFVESAYPEVLRKLLKARGLMHDPGLGFGDRPCSITMSFVERAWTWTCCGGC